jgi:cyclopropane fatty-acyl-phospholipid synthase-like methyltransferase
VSADETDIAAYYDALVDRYGHDPRAVDATSSEALDVRYSALAGVADLTGKRVLEVGCGFGDLGVHLAARFGAVRYTGIDVSARMIEVGHEAHPSLDLRHASFADFTPGERYDVVLAQGIFYLLGHDAERKAQALIQRMFEVAQEAVAFTAISTWGDAPEAGEYRVDPVALLAWARTLTRSLTVRHDYHPGDVCFYLYKSSRP